MGDRPASATSPIGIGKASLPSSLQNSDNPPVHPRTGQSGQGRVAPQSQVYTSWDSLPLTYRQLFEKEGSRDFFLTRGWFEHFSRTALDPECKLRIYGLEWPGDSEPAVAFVACSRPRDKESGSLRRLTALTNYYSCFFAPHLAQRAPARERRCAHWRGPSKLIGRVGTPSTSILWPWMMKLFRR